MLQQQYEHKVTVQTFETGGIPLRSSGSVNLILSCRIVETLLNQVEVHAWKSMINDLIIYLRATLRLLSCL